MSEQPQTPESGGDAAGETPGDTPAPLEPTETPQPAAPPPPPPPPAAAAAADSAAGTDRPEIAIGAAFAGGFLFAMILRRLAR